MRYVSFQTPSGSSYGAIEGSQVVELASAVAPTLRSRLLNGPLPSVPEVRTSGGRRLPLAELTLLPPITDPDKIICVGLNYRSHAAETGLAIPDHPSLFVRFRGSQVGHGRPIVRPSASLQFDYEAELAVIIGRAGRHVPVAAALEYVAGYSCFAENSVRDWQRHAPQITPGKNFHSSGAFGPWLATPDELPTLSQVEVIGRLNGRVVQRDSVGGLIFPIPELIAYISSFTELLPGDVISTGTPAGVGVARTPPVFMQPGDVLEVEVTGVGVLRNTVVAEDRT